MSRAVSSLSLTRDGRLSQREHDESERLLEAAREAARRALEAAAKVDRMNAIYRERLVGVRRTR